MLAVPATNGLKHIFKYANLMITMRLLPVELLDLDTMQVLIIQH